MLFISFLVGRQTTGFMVLWIADLLINVLEKYDFLEYFINKKNFTVVGIECKGMDEVIGRIKDANKRMIIGHIFQLLEDTC